MTNEHDLHETIEATPFQRAEAAGKKPLFRIGIPQVIVGSLFLVLLVAVGFMVLAKAVKVTFTPEADTFRFTSGFHYQLGERYLMLPGTYEFSAGKQGYKLLNGTVEVTDEADQDYTFELVKLPGILNIETTPEANATVLVDQVEVGTTPLTIDPIEVGLHDISIRSERYLPYDTEVDIEGMRNTQSLTLELAPAWADVTITSKPEGAAIMLGETVIGETPQTVELIQGEQVVTLRKEGFKRYQQTVSVSAGDVLTLNEILLEKSDGKVSITSVPAGANVNINGKYRGQTPINVTLPPGQNYEVRLSRAGYNPLTRKLAVKPSEDVGLHETLTPILGVVRLQVEPAVGTLFVDGKDMGNPNQRLSLSARQHEIKVTAPGYADYVATVVPQPGSTQQLLVRMKTTAEAKADAIPTEIVSHVGASLKLIIPGELEMGAGRREPGRRSNEIEKRVKLTRAYYLGTREISNLEFNQFDPGHDSGILGRALLNDDDRPVVNLTWQEAAAFCNWLSEKEGLPAAYRSENGRLVPVFPMNTGYRMPTEAEWAWAARYANGPTPTRFPWGDNMPPVEIEANYADESAISMVPYHINGYDDSYRGPAPVGTYPANEFGIYDLAGNVSEWIHDFYSIETFREQLVDPAGPEQGEYHVIRGSSFQHGRFSELRWTYRDYGDSRRPDVGFRIARYLE